MKLMLRVLFWVLLLAVPAFADKSDLQAMRTADESRGWEAVGQLNMEGRAFCTGALIAPDLVLTAAHCMVNADTGRVFEPSGIEFRAGWRGGRAQSYRRGRRVLIHPTYLDSPDMSRARIRNDVALLELDRPIRDTRTIPFKTGSFPRKGAEVSVVSYARDRAVDPSIEPNCDVLARQFGVLVLNCSVDFGSSGAPIFSIHQDGVQIVSVVSAKSVVQGQDVSFGTALTQPLLDLLKIRAEGGGVFVSSPASNTRPTVLRNRGLGGAKFLKVQP
ncbi:MAG: trypsin-like serine protease [Pseudomonadota bacterium]